MSVSKVKVAIQLFKTLHGPWALLEKKPCQSTEPFKNPSSKKAVDWDKIDAYNEDEANDLNSFFKKIYAQGDDDTRRAMMKSLQESGGTVLSTNWADIGNRQVSGHRPGQQ